MSDTVIRPAVRVSARPASSLRPEFTAGIADYNPAHSRPSTLVPVRKGVYRTADGGITVVRPNPEKGAWIATHKATGLTVTSITRGDAYDLLLGALASKTAPAPVAPAAPAPGARKGA